jgi:predicted NodU family carbamoyl transferase
LRTASFQSGWSATCAPSSSTGSVSTRTPPLFCFDHHLAHAPSAFYASGFQKVTVATGIGIE